MSEVLDGRTYWYAASMEAPLNETHAAYLLPNYDEFVSGFRDNTGAWEPIPADHWMFYHMVVIDGRIVGTWKRTLSKRAVLVEWNAFELPTPVQEDAVAAAAAKYGAFLGLPAQLERV